MLQNNRDTRHWCLFSSNQKSHELLVFLGCSFYMDVYLQYVIFIRVGGATKFVYLSCTTGIGLTLNSVQYTNNSVVTITDIGTGNAALLCTTTYRPCCSSANQETQWYLPNGTQLSSANTQPYYRTRSRSPGVVCLHRNPGATTTGIFHCDIPDASGDLQSIYVGIYTATTGMSCRFTQHIFISVRALILKLSQVLLQP